MARNPAEVFAEAVRNLRFLIADPSAGRKSIRKLLSDLHVSPVKVDLVESYSEAAELLKAKLPNVVFTDESLDGQGPLGLLELQKSLASPNSLRVFFLATSKDSNASLTGATDESIDGMLLKPFTFASLSETFKDVLQKKLTPSDYDKAMDAGRYHFRDGKFTEAMLAFTQAQSLTQQPALALYWLAKTAEAMGKPDDARQLYSEGLAADPSHYRCLTGLVILLDQQKQYAEAYSVARTLCEHHSAPMKLMPTLIRLSVFNKKFEEVLGFYKDADSIIAADPKAGTSLAAGLVVCGISLLKSGHQSAAIDSFKKAELASRGAPKILERIYLALTTHGLVAEMPSLFERVPAEYRNSREIRVAELKFLETQAGNDLGVLQIALDMLRKGVTEPDIYALAIRKSIQVGRKSEHVMILLQEACQKHPDHSEEFNKLAAPALGRS